MYRLNESSTKRLLCDVCGNIKSTNGMQQVFGGICICSECIDGILSLYVSSNPIKTLCPYCHDKKGDTDTEKCKYCSIKLSKKDKNNES